MSRSAIRSRRLDTWCMAIMGMGPARPAQWLKDNKGALPSLLALALVVVFWVVGIVGGMRYLDGATSPMAVLTGLYVGLAAVAVSIIIATLAVSDLLRRLPRKGALQRTAPWPPR